MTHPLIERLTREYGYPELTADSLQPFLEQSGHSLLLLAGDPGKYPEALDLAVILPELVKAFDGIAAAVVAPAAEEEMQARFGFTAWPTLVLMRGEGYLGALSRTRDWSVYLAEIEALLSAPTRRPPSVGVSVRAERSAPCGG